jgi:hypothetical protein
MSKDWGLELRLILVLIVAGRSGLLVLALALARL